MVIKWYIRLILQLGSAFGSISRSILTIISRAMTNKNAITTQTPSSRAISSSVTTKITQAYELFSKLLEKYSPDEVFVAFNGGKDCTVALDLLSKYYKQHENHMHCVIPVLYIRSKNPFPQLDEFVENCVNTYPIEMIRGEGSIKLNLERICAERPNLKAVVMGVRKTDPRASDLKKMQHTDPGWPPLLRTNPLLEWTSRDIWSYLLDNQVRYCSLYDMGYTSLGDKTNTLPNEHLKCKHPDTGEVTYRPAYELMDDTLERDGRF